MANRSGAGVTTNDLGVFTSNNPGVESDNSTTKTMDDYGPPATVDWVRRIPPLLK